MSGADAPDAPRRSRVLIVQGEAKTHAALLRGLASESLDVVEAADARAAVDRVAAERFDLILLDMRNLQLLRLLKGDSHSSLIPVIMIADAADDDGVVDCLEAGADDYLATLHPVVLRIRVSAALEKKRLRDTEKTLHERIGSTRRSHDRVMQKILSASKLEIAQYQDTIKALRKQLDAEKAGSKATIDAARAAAAAELRQLRATVRALRDQLDAAALGIAPGIPPQVPSDRSSPPDVR